MKQLLQSLKDGTTQIADIPAPRKSIGQCLIQTSVSLVSAGTERMLIEFGKGSILKKAKSQPDKVKLVVQKAKTDGVLTTLESVRSKLDQPIALGYCNVGKIIETDLEGFNVGDRVVSNGPHAEIVSVPKNLCAKIPVNVSDEQASFTVLAAIGLQGIRLAKPTLGEYVVVVGLGLIGLLTVQMLRAHGCSVLGIDYNLERCRLAESFGAETISADNEQAVLSKAASFSRSNGVDAVLITASTNSNEPVSLSAKMCRKRGRIILVGVTGLHLNRSEFYEKELTFQVSCSYGPGRYDSNYEENGHDYPLPYVRWTEQRNFEAVLNLMASGSLDVTPLISHRFDINEGKLAYETLTTDTSTLGILLEYPERHKQLIQPARIMNLEVEFSQCANNVAFLGAGNYAGRILIPAFKKSGLKLHTLVSNGGVSAVHFGKKFKFYRASSDENEIICDPEISAIVIATRHNLHANQILSALKSGKHVFCEKPLCLTLEELNKIELEARSRPSQLLMVGFNRRYSPFTMRIKQLLYNIHSPKHFIMTVNAGKVPSDHWTQIAHIGGGRIIGECCHFIDLLRYIAGAPIVKSSAICLGQSGPTRSHDDIATVTLQFEDGSVGVINYLANGHKSVPKERLEVFVDGRVIQLDNFRKLTNHGFSANSNMKSWKQNKGQNECVAHFANLIEGKVLAKNDLDGYLEVSRVAIELGRNLLE